MHHFSKMTDSRDTTSPLIVLARKHKGQCAMVSARPKLPLACFGVCGVGQDSNCEIADEKARDDP